jgi:hypothetical protein
VHVPCRHQRVREKIAHPDASALDLATIMHTVGDPLRLDIVRLLADDRPRPCSEVSSAMGLPVRCSYLAPAARGRWTRTRARERALHPLRRDDLEERFPGLGEVLTHESRSTASTVASMLSAPRALATETRW